MTLLFFPLPLPRSASPSTLPFVVHANGAGRIHPLIQNHQINFLCFEFLNNSRQVDHRSGQAVKFGYDENILIPDKI